MKIFRKHPRIKGYVLIADYPGNRRGLGHFEPYTTGLYSIYPHIWKEVLYDDVIRDEKLKELGIK
jgi:hypothetical protein